MKFKQPRLWRWWDVLFRRSGGTASARLPKLHILDPLEGRRLLSGTGLAGSYFAQTNLLSVKFARTDATINFQWPSGTPAGSLGTDGFSVRWDGWVQPNFSETYTFTVTSNDGVKLWIGKTLVVNTWSSHSLQQGQGNISLLAGKKYPIRIEYWSDGTNTPGIHLSWQSPSQPMAIIPKNRLYPAALDSIKPSAPPDLRVTSVTDRSATVAWDPSSDPSGVVAYQLYQGSSYLGVTAPSQLSFVRSGLAALTGYRFSVQAIDAAGNLSAMSTTATTTASPTARPPSTPKNLHVTGTTNTTISLAWSASTDPDGNLAGYRVYRDGLKIGAPSGASYTDRNLTPGTMHSYVVRAVDSTSLSSGVSSSVSGATTGARDAFAGITASSFNASNGVVASGSDLTFLDDGDWARYSSVNFGNGANSVSLNLATPNIGGRIELHIDSVDGPLIANHLVQPTGSVTTFFQQKLNVSSVSGIHDLYLVFKDRSDIGNLRSITFSTQRLTRIMALGDSITAGDADAPNYRYYLWKKLQQAGFPVDFVGSLLQGWNGGPPNLDFDQNHEGRGGIRADEVAADVAQWASDNTPDIVLLHIGSNDIDDGQDPAGIISEIGDIIDNLRSVNPNVTVLVAQIIPEVGHESDMAALNALIPGLASSKDTSQSRVIAVDCFTGFNANTDTVEGTHPNATGDQKLADDWYNALVPLLQ